MITPELPSAGTPGSMAPTQRQIESLRGLGIGIETVQMVGTPILKYASGYVRMRRRLRDVDLIHAHYGYCGWLARLQLRKPIVISFMGSDVYGDPDDRGRSDLLSSCMAYTHRRWLAPRANTVIVKSPQMAELMAPTPCHVISNGIDLEVFRPAPTEAARDRLGWKPDKSYVLFPGNPENPRKGFTLARSTIAQLNSRLATSAELVPLWNVSPDDVPWYMNACDAMLMVSHAEGSPNVVKEALACNCPIVSVPVGDVETVLSDVEGCQICPRDASLLATALHDSLVRGQRSKGREVIQRLHLDLESVAQRVIEIYRNTLLASGLGDAVSMPNQFGPETS